MNKYGAERCQGYDSKLEAAVGAILRIRERAGEDAMAVLASARLTNEASYLAQKLARAHQQDFGVKPYKVQR